MSGNIEKTTEMWWIFRKSRKRVSFQDICSRETKGALKQFFCLFLSIQCVCEKQIYWFPTVYSTALFLSKVVTMTHNYHDVPSKLLPQLYWWTYLSMSKGRKHEVKWCQTMRSEVLHLWRPLCLLPAFFTALKAESNLWVRTGNPATNSTPSEQVDIDRFI